VSGVELPLALERKYPAAGRHPHRPGAARASGRQHDDGLRARSEPSPFDRGAQHPGRIGVLQPMGGCWPPFPAGEVRARLGVAREGARPRGRAGVGLPADGLVPASVTSPAGRTPCRAGGTAAPRGHLRTTRELPVAAGPSPFPQPVRSPALPAPRNPALVGLLLCGGCRYGQETPPIGRNRYPAGTARPVAGLLLPA
jgi:hypothetical protein